MMDRTEFRRNRPKMSAALKLVLLVAIVAGYFVTKQCRQDMNNYLITSKIEVSDYQAGDASADVHFDLTNNSGRKGFENFLINIYGKNNELIAFKLVRIYLIPNTTKRYLRYVDVNFSRAIKENEKLTATVKVHTG